MLDLLRRGECVAGMSPCRESLSCLVASSHFPASPPLLCMQSPKNLPSTVLFQQSLLHVPGTLTWNLAGYWVPACTGESARVSLRLIWGGESLSTIFHSHFFPLRITVAMHEFTKPLAIKLILGTTRAVGVNRFNMKIPVKRQPWLKQWDWSSCVREP